MKSFAIFRMDRFLLVSIQEEIDDISIDLLLEELASSIQSKRIQGVILDLHQVDMIDSFMAESIKKVALMLKALDAGAVVSGLRVSAVMTLIDFNISLHDVDFSLDIDDAVIKLNGLLNKRETNSPALL